MVCGLWSVNSNLKRKLIKSFFVCPPFPFPPEEEMIIGNFNLFSKVFRLKIRTSTFVPQTFFYFLGRFAPYFDLRWVLPATPAVSKAPLTM